MCIIITKEKNAKPLPNKVFDKCWDANPNGAGILYNNGKTTTLIKGIMEKKEFLKRVKEANKKECSFIVHCRIATHGSVKPENTHPFVSTTLGFAHNGTLPIVPEKDMTDSETFFLNTIADKSFKWCKDNKWLLEMATLNSRCAIFDMKTGDIIHLNKENWVEDKDYPGYVFSNSYYKTERYSYLTGTLSTLTAKDYNRYASSWYDDEDWDDWDARAANYQAMKTQAEKEEEFAKWAEDLTIPQLTKATTEVKLRFSCLSEVMDKFKDKRRTLPEYEVADMKEHTKMWKEVEDDYIRYCGTASTEAQVGSLMRQIFGYLSSTKQYDVETSNQIAKAYVRTFQVKTAKDEEFIKICYSELGI